jgi:hypothetical protein
LTELSICTGKYHPAIHGAGAKECCRPTHS